MNPPSIYAFKDKGFKVYINHERPVILDDQCGRFIPFLPAKQLDRFLRENLMSLKEIKVSRLQDRIFPRGGVTTLKLERDGHLVYETKSVCSAKDIFSRKVGIMKCLYRASSILALPFTHENP